MQSDYRIDQCRNECHQLSCQLTLVNERKEEAIAIYQEAMDSWGREYGRIGLLSFKKKRKAQDSLETINALRRSVDQFDTEKREVERKLEKAQSKMDDFI